MILRGLFFNPKKSGFKIKFQKKKKKERERRENNAAGPEGKGPGPHLPLQNIAFAATPDAGIFAYV